MLPVAAAAAAAACPIMPAICRALAMMAARLGWQQRCAPMGGSICAPPDPAMSIAAVPEDLPVAKRIAARRLKGSVSCHAAKEVLSHS